MRWAAMLVGSSLFAFAITPVMAAHYSAYGVPPQAIVIVLTIFVLALTQPALFKARVSFTSFEWLLIGIMVVSVTGHEVPRGAFLRTSQLLVGISLALLASLLVNHPARWRLCVRMFTWGLALSATVVILQFSGLAGC